MFRRSPLAVTVLTLVLFGVGFYAALEFRGKNDETVTRTQIALGTLIEIKVRGMQTADADAAMTAALYELRRVDTLFSTYLPESPVWRLNHTEATVVRVPPEIHDLMLRCDTLWERSNGAFDIAIEEVLRAWKFDSGNPAIPTDHVLTEALGRSGWRQITLEQGNYVRRSTGATLNFGSVAKGYAVDRAVAILRQYGVTEALINAGGDIRAIGGEWQVGIQHPRSPSELLTVVRLDGRAIATSGDYEQYFEEGGVRYHHIFDPATGFPARGLRSVSVIADDVATADAVSTAAFVLGTGKGLEFLRDYPDIEGLIVDEHGVEHSTPGFERYRKR
ncbi:MAG: FAD:protein FMN transferase [Bacteroidetes bacterium]|nr:FAD:protein FMN transferase [Bacteroidota bacterium]